MTLIEVHAVVEQAIATLMTLRDKLPAEIGDDTARTIGRGLGLIDNGRLPAGTRHQTDAKRQTLSTLATWHIADRRGTKPTARRAGPRRYAAACGA